MPAEHLTCLNLFLPLRLKNIPPISPYLSQDLMFPLYHQALPGLEKAWYNITILVPFIGTVTIYTTLCSTAQQWQVSLWQSHLGQQLDSKSIKASQRCSLISKHFGFRLHFHLTGVPSKSAPRQNSWMLCKGSPSASLSSVNIEKHNTVLDFHSVPLCQDLHFEAEKWRGKGR